jgi:hypothetical protein
MWLHHFKPGTKRQSVKWHHEFSVEKEVQGCTFSGKVMVTAFWDMGEGYSGGNHAQRNHHKLRGICANTAKTSCMSAACLTAQMHAQCFASA